VKFLFTAGDSFMSLSYLFCLGQATISDIVCKVCDAIRSLQQDYLRVAFFQT